SCLFFFSSRRRHTRWPRDWSSDVCSSDLCTNGCPTSGTLGSNALKSGVTLEDLLRNTQASALATKTFADLIAYTDPQTLHNYTRSEERRVGKECRSRWSADHEKKKKKKKN